MDGSDVIMLLEGSDRPLTSRPLLRVQRGEFEPCACVLVPVLKFELEGLEALRGIGSEEKHDADALSPTPRATNVQTSTIPEEDLGEDGGVVSALGGSYVDGLPKGPSVSQSQQEEDEALEDGGVLGLLAQIYGTSAGLTTKGGRGLGRGAP